MVLSTDERHAPVRVLFLCTGNSARSQMAEAFLRYYGRDRFAVASAGTEPARELHPLASLVMREVGIPLDGQYPKSLASVCELALPWDYVITTCDDANDACPTLPNDPLRIHWRFDDPARSEGTLEERKRVFRRVRDEIRRRVQLFAALRSHQRPTVTRPGTWA